MSTATVAEKATPSGDAQRSRQYDAIVIGAGLAGIYQLYRLREMGLDARAFEAGSGVGGTWYWNRYPGARFDSQAEVYQFWISKELYKSWTPSERFPAQEETERWINHVVDQLELRPHIQLNTQIAGATWDEKSGHWNVSTKDGQQMRCRYLFACSGVVSAPLKNLFPGENSFRGPIYYTANWPKAGVDVKGKRVAVIGNGATGIQVIQTIAKDVAAMKAFVRTPQYCVPMRNPKYSQNDWDRYVDRYDELKGRVQNTFTGFEDDFANPPWAELTPEQRNDILEKYWADGSLSFWVCTFPEVFFDPDVNEEISEFVRNKMRARLKHDPELCRKLIPGPDDYGFGTRRVPLETNFLEVFLQDNVEVISGRDTSIEAIVPQGIKTSDGQVHEVDVIIMAVGFDGASGALRRMDIRGRDGRSLSAQWGKELRTTLGLQVHGYPNLFVGGSPLAPIAALCNFPTCMTQQVDWVTELVAYAREHDKTIIEATEEFEDEWVRHHDEVANQTLFPRTNSWYTGTNVKGKQRRLLAYAGGVNTYGAKCKELAAAGYPGFDLR